jgi:hypothetical protein
VGGGEIVGGGEVVSVDEVRETVVAAGAMLAAGVAAGASAGARAARLGHATSIVHERRRFRIVCTCGWSTDQAWKRKHAFRAVADHVFGVIAADLRGGLEDVGGEV